MQFFRSICPFLAFSALSLAPPSSAQTQTIWFSPLVPASWNNNIGSIDYLDLFAPGAPWVAASSHIQVFKMYTQMIVPDFPGSFPDGDLQQIFDYLNSHNIALAIEFAPLTPTASCGNGIEGFAGETALTLATRIQQLGGNLRYIAMDEPFTFGNLYTGALACNWTAQQIATNALQNIAQIKTIFPDVIVGDIEGVPPASGSPGWLSDYMGWIDTWTATAGAPFDFFHFDVGWQTDWRPSVESLREALFQREIPFGIIYNGVLADSTDADWVNDAASHYANWEGQGGTIPDHVIFQSWHPYPQHVLPESDPFTLTYLIDSYFRQRTRLLLNAISSPATGTLIDSHGAPITSAPLTVTAQATAGPGSVSNYVIGGTVPPSITQALVQICVKQCGDTGVTDISVYSFSYVDSGGPTTLNFTQGLTGWGVEGGGSALVQLGSDANGKSLQISATTSQQTFINSDPPFTVVPGSTYSFSVRALIPPSSAGSGSFALVFLNTAGAEVSRATVEFAAGTSTVGSVETSSDGSYGLPLPSFGNGAFQIQAAYAGTDSQWPAFATSPSGSAPWVPWNGIVNAADFKAEPFAPGTWFTIFGQNLGSAGQWASTDTFTLGGASVFVCGEPAAISFNSGPVITNGATGWQLNVLMPDSVAGQTLCPVVISIGGGDFEAANVNISSGIMELFTFTTPSGLLPIITHAGYSLVGPSSAGLVPAQPGEILIAWGTGDCVTPSITVGGAATVVAFSGQVEPGLCQVNFSLPDNLTGNSELIVSTSPTTYVLEVQN